MRTSARNRKLVSFGAASLVAMVAFQNCARGGFTLEEPFVGMSEDDAILKIQDADSQSRDVTTMPVAQYSCTAHLDQLPNQDIPLRPTESVAKCFRQCEVISQVLDLASGSLSCSATALAQPQPSDQQPNVIVVGVYESDKDHSKTGATRVHLKGSGKPVILVLTNYESTDWTVDAEHPEDIQKVVVLSYEDSSAIVSGADVPIEKHSAQNDPILSSFVSHFTAPDQDFERTMADKNIFAMKDCSKLLHFNSSTMAWEGIDAYSKCAKYFAGREGLHQIEKELGFKIVEVVGDYTSKGDYDVSEIPVIASFIGNPPNQ